METNIGEKKVTNLMLKFAVVSTETGTLFNFAPFTVIIGNQFYEKLKAQQTVEDSPTYHIQALLEEQLVPSCFHVKII